MAGWAWQMTQKERKAERPKAHQGPTVHQKLDPACQEPPEVAPDRQGLAPGKCGREGQNRENRAEQNREL
jgi:hypothetical protein